MPFSITDYFEYVNGKKIDSTLLATIEGYIPKQPAKALGQKNVSNGLRVSGNIKINSVNVSLNFFTYEPPDVRDEMNAALIAAGLNATVVAYLTRIQNGKIYLIGFKSVAKGVTASILIEAPDSGENALTKILMPVGHFYGTNGFVKKFYFSNTSYSSQETDTPPNQQFEPLILSIPYQQKTISVFDSGGKSDIGELVLSNDQGDLDGWVEYDFKGKPVTLMFGSLNWPLVNFQTYPVYVGAVRNNQDEFNPTITEKTISFRFSDILEQLNTVHQTNIMGSGTPDEGKIKPLIYGCVKNITPRKNNESTQQRLVNDGVIEAITAIYDGGGNVTANWTINLSAATATPNGGAKPKYTLTMDVKGLKTDGVWLQKPGEIIKSIIKRSGLFSDSNLSVTDITNIDTVKPYLISLYVHESEKTITLVDRILNSIGAYRIVDFENKIRFGFFKDPRIEIPIAYLNSDNIIGDVVVTPIFLPRKTTRLKGDQNWTVINSGSILPALSDEGSGLYDPARVTWLENEWRIKTSVLTSEYSVTELEPEETVLYNLTDVQLECEFRQSFFNTPILSFSLKTGDFFQLLPGDIVNVSYDRYGMLNSINAQLSSVAPNYTEGTNEIKGFFFYDS